ncbi:hypothetical protein ILYODFUR_037433 [Ilyodon furcidens]|uniref:Uncharacterized protein n=1 Tax=Ilyodon furcidens TaxID=33524 RepID=A0ABV0UYF1_9TELE
MGAPNPEKSCFQLQNFAVFFRLQQLATMLAGAETAATSTKAASLTAPRINLQPCDRPAAILLALYSCLL